MTTPSSNPSCGPAPRWTHDQIRSARLAPVLPILQRRGFQLRPLEADNFEVTAFPGLLIKDSYWRWPERDLAGNAIDLCMRLLGMSFHDAMREITGS